MTSVINLSTYQTVIDEIVNNWATYADLIAAPNTIAKGRYDAEAQDGFPAVFVDWKPFTFPVATTGFGSTDDAQNRFDIAIEAFGISDTMKYLTIVRKILNAKSIEGGHWHVEGGTPFEHGDQEVVILQLIETIFNP